MNTRFENWRSDWEAAKNAVGDTQMLLTLWKRSAPTGWKREGWNLPQGFRSSGAKRRGEQKIEACLLGSHNGINVHWIQRGNQRWPFVAMHHRLPMANQRKSQVIADAFGLVILGREVHPVVAEVKVGANNCWSAMVQNLLQIRMLRHCHQTFKREHASNFQGVWGIVLAPAKYFERDLDKFKACQVAMKSLKSTEARVAFCSSDKLDKHMIEYLAGNWR